MSLEKIGGFWFRQFEFFDLWDNSNQHRSLSLYLLKFEGMQKQKAAATTTIGQDKG
jgi:hypothetical protein